jgi:predicted HTH domain antitoxin
MHAVNIRQLKSNPSVALREAKNDLVVVMNRDRPDAVLVSMEQLGVADLPHVRTAFAVSLFRSGDLSAGTAAKVAGKPLAEMLALLSSMNIPLYGGSPKEAVDEMALDEAWLKRAS